MSSLFSPFTLYKPYLLIMYDLWQSIQLIKQTSNICLEKDVKKWKKYYPQVNDAQILQHIVKYKLSSSIQGFPWWHQSWLQDLLTMVQEFGVPHFFLTLK
jgi:ATP-dependent DNA helicase PIF1